MAPRSGDPLACRRTSSRPRGRRSWTRWRQGCSQVVASGAVTPPRRRRDQRRRERRRCARGVGRVSHEIPLARPLIGAEEERRVIDVLRSRQLSLGAELPAFEREFAAYLGAAHASAVSSGTAGLHLALRAQGVSDGDEVVTSPLSFVASANAIVYERARPVFADI
ncbi:MAG: hypothetical protein DLM63_00725, partial [Solirubrobacterales bacterium]